MTDTFRSLQFPVPSANLLDQVEFLRLDAARRLDETRRVKLGQFLTPAPIARFMASMIDSTSPSIRLVDPGAGVGTLFAACIAELCARPERPARISVTAFELDAMLAEYLGDTFRLCKGECDRTGVEFEGEVIIGDFIEAAVEMLQGSLFTSTVSPRFNCAILNPPYLKIRTSSVARALLRRIGVETTNLYSGFLAATYQLLEPNGQLVAITPRSFCNGPYFRPFREGFLRTMALRRLHVFESREDAFRDDAVLQENIVYHAIKSSEKPDTVLITSSAGPDDGMVSILEAGYEQVIYPSDPQQFIHIVPDKLGQKMAARMAQLTESLGDLNISVSTGRVVDFRAHEYLRAQPAENTAPLIYPAHLENGGIHWPKAAGRKPNALVVTEQSQDLLLPSEYYVLVKRFSSKEEKRRVVAAVYDPRQMPGPYVAFENHLNYFHRNGRGLDPALAHGLAAFLNSTLVDSCFRQFNGHTQVNATDLRSMRFPTAGQLEKLGALALSASLDQAQLDKVVEAELFGMSETGDTSPEQTQRRIREANEILKSLGLPRGQQNERSALTLLALLHVRPDTPWSEAADPLRGITPIIEFIRQHYGKSYAPSTRETVRRQTVHQFLETGRIVANPDDPNRPVNSPKTVYQVESSTLGLLRSYGTDPWSHNLRAYLASIETLKRRYASERQMARIPVRIAPEKTITLSPGGQNVLVKRVIEGFAASFTPGGELLYVGDTDEKFAYFEEERLAELGIVLDAHGKMPDVVIYHVEKDWLVLVEAVTSHGPVDGKRRDELSRLFRGANVGLVYVTAFLDRKAMVAYLDEISWETEVWVADAPTHLIHFNGERFLGPYE